ncbi:MAG: ATP-dependent DNA helicase RecG [Anaerolineaceae bacterium]|nr:ATP-dependent DNA helicase RecG [Anaerolineaceae bacterium]
MPTALETLVKILRLEREQRCRDSAVAGGLGAFSKVWEPDALRQARNNQQRKLVEELRALMQGYSGLSNVEARAERVQFMLDRIHARVQPETGQDAATRPGDRASSRNRRDRKNRKPRRQGRNQNSGREQGRRSRRSVRASRPDIAARATLEQPPRRQRAPQDPAKALAQMRHLEQPLTVLQGIGDRRAEVFARLGIHTLADLLYFMPRRHDDYRQERYLGRLEPDMRVTVVGGVRRCAIRHVAGGRRDFHVTLEDESGHLDALFFGQHWLNGQIKVGDLIVLSGRTSLRGTRLQIINPEWEPLDPANLQTVGLVPVYPLTDGLTQRGMRRLMRDVVPGKTRDLPDPVPEATLERAGLADLAWALQQAHFPEGPDHLRHARDRLLFDELLALQLAVLENRREWQSRPAEALAMPDEDFAVLQAGLFPFELTEAQQQAVTEIRQDMAAEVPMNRLLQGDVGSGKTAVAILAMLLAARAGRQAALIVPLSVLAGQHFRNLSETFARLPEDNRPSLALLTGATRGEQRKAILADLASGALDIVVGTHALLQEGIDFSDVGLVIIDEQHRFGVGQRRLLRGKGRNPHLLLMTATPIPRSLALTLYADLDLSVIDELPPGRGTVQTTVIEPVARERAFSFVATELARGRQAFIVHPLVEESENTDVRAAVSAWEELVQVFHRFRLALLHGRMSVPEKDEVLRAFSRGDTDVLVTTSVAEVGVDVPNASVMVIEGANRFGLAQLHQFRGRVGRGEHASHCLLIPDSREPAARERLEALEQYSDGFSLAELDWQMRGSGDLAGMRQSGGSLLQMAEFLTPQLVALARREARTIALEDPGLALPEHELLAFRVNRLRDRRSDVS